MTMQLMRRAVQLFSSPYVPRSTNKHNRAAWLRSVQHLGDRWVLLGSAPVKWGHGEQQPKEKQ